MTPERLLAGLKQLSCKHTYFKVKERKKSWTLLQKNGWEGNEMQTLLICVADGMDKKVVDLFIGSIPG